MREVFLNPEKSDIWVWYDLFGSMVLLDYGNGGRRMDWNMDESDGESLA